MSYLFAVFKGDIITECTDGDSRLVDGIIEQEGRVEVCVNGVWSSICDYSWSVIDAYVFCVTLGYNGDSASKSNNHYGCSLFIIIITIRSYSSL